MNVINYFQVLLSVFLATNLWGNPANTSLPSLSPGGASELRALIDEGRYGQASWPGFRDYRAELRRFYASRAYTLAWSHASSPTPQALELIRIFQNAEDRGLRSEDYAGSDWVRRLETLKSSGASESDWIDFDAALTACAMRYVTDIHVGRINPQKFNFEIDMKTAKEPLFQFIQRHLENATDIDKELAVLEPPFPAYQRALKAYQTYRELSRTDDGEVLPMPTKAKGPESPYPGVPRLVRLLTLMGDLPAKENVENATLDSPSLLDAIRHFQRRHGLRESGKLDSETLRQLNIPFGRRVMQLQLTLERWHWLPHDFPGPPLVVNIPEFRLHADDEAFHWVFSMKVVVGKAYRRRTPVFSSEIDSVIFRPYWNVPGRIIREEMIPEIKKDPEYLARGDYEVVDQDDVVVATGTVSATVLMGLQSGRLTLRQIPGPHNALGLIKFVMPDSYDVYLHDTPAKELFEQSRRDFSHGCIRVENPVLLGSWVLRNNAGWSPAHILSAMTGQTTLTVRLSRPVPVLIVYGTAVVMEDGEVRFFDDIYGYDRVLEKALTLPDQIAPTSAEQGLYPRG